MTTDLEQTLFDLLWDDDTAGGATQAAALCATEPERDHALWIAVACQKSGAVNALLEAGASAGGRAAALSLLCSGLVMVSEPVEDDAVTAIDDWTVRPINRLKPPGAPPIWFEAEQAMGRYVDKRGDDGAWLTMIPELLDDVPSALLGDFRTVLQQAIGDEITTAQAMLQAEIDRRILEAV
ncbi:MAG: hypothetical protein EPN58_11530 [Rhodanobacter sp.]|nr:MAG: hypothetical protein EPN58_11530 [Rhodanobacter sp.]